MKVAIFYPWQSDLPNHTNRSLIERALQKAIDPSRPTPKPSWNLAWSGTRGVKANYKVGVHGPPCCPHPNLKLPRCPTQVRRIATTAKKP